MQMIEDDEGMKEKDENGEGGEEGGGGTISV